MRCSRFPCAGIIEPSVGADDRARPMLALEFRVVGELVMRYGSVRSEARYFDVADVAALPLACLVLQVLDEFFP